MSSFFCPYWGGLTAFVVGCYEKERKQTSQRQTEATQQGFSTIVHHWYVSYVFKGNNDDVSLDISTNSRVSRNQLLNILWFGIKLLVRFQVQSIIHIFVSINISLHNDNLSGWLKTLFSFGPRHFFPPSMFFFWHARIGDVGRVRSKITDGHCL